MKVLYSCQNRLLQDEFLLYYIHIHNSFEYTHSNWEEDSEELSSMYDFEEFKEQNGIDGQ